MGPTCRAGNKFVAIVEYYEGIRGVSGGCKDDTHDCMIVGVIYNCLYSPWEVSGIVEKCKSS